MSHSVSSTTGHSKHETLIPLASYPDSQRKDSSALCGEASSPWGRSRSPMRWTCGAGRSGRATHWGAHRGGEALAVIEVVKTLVGLALDEAILAEDLWARRCH
eukprot:487404-Pyramimonas_sp.AAC.1